jgi:hypothetical protein
MVKHRHTVKKLSRRKSRVARKRGGGWSEGPNFVSPGNLIHNQYPGPGKDCAGEPARYGLTTVTPKGLPGLSGGKRRVLRKKYGGQLVVANPNMPPTSGSITPLPGNFPNPSGYGGTVSAPGVPPKPVQNGGRYGFFPSMGPLNPENGVGVSPPPFGRIPCESGTHNPLNPNPGNIQGLTTAPSVPAYTTMKGGANGVTVGAVDSMRYYAPTAGYGHNFETYPAPSPVPGLMINTPYDARAFNRACLTTGGAASFSPLKMNEITTRFDFDGTKNMLPVKYGGKRKTRRHRKTKRHGRK